MSLNRLCRCLHALVAAGIVACGSETPPSGPDLTAPAAIFLIPDSLRLLYNDTARVRAVVVNVQGDTLPNAPVAFVSSDTTVASVDSGGLVQALAAGVSDMTITSGAVTASLLVRVRVNGTLALTPGLSFMRAADTVQLSAVVKDSTGVVVPNPVIEYQSEDSSVARVLPSGKVVFGGSAGTVIITAISEGRKNAVFVTAVVARLNHVHGSIFAVNANGDLFAYVPEGGLGYFYRYSLPDTFPTAAVHRNIEGFGSAAVDAPASRLYVGDDYFGTITILDVAADGVVNVIDVTQRPFTPRPPYAMAVAPNGQLYFNADSAVSRLDAFSATPLFQFGQAYHTVIRDSLLYVSGDADIREFNLRSGSLGRQFADTRYAYDLALSEDGTRLYHTMNVAGLRIGVWNLTTGDTLPSLTFGGYVGPGDYGYTSLAVQPTMGLLWIITGSGRVLVIDPISRRIVRSLRLGGTPQGIAFTASGLGVVGNSRGWIDYVR